ncbi:hypothetical protein RFI_30291, partial [Reticulomyxa filosa]
MFFPSWQSLVSSDVLGKVYAKHFNRTKLTLKQLEELSTKVKEYWKHLDLRVNQPTAMTAFLIARYLRTSSFIILIDMISYINIILLILDLLYGLYLWKKTKYEILLIDKIQTNILIKNIIKSLCILPISSYGNSCFFKWNGYKGSNQIEQSLSNLIQIQNHIQNQINQSNNTITTLNYIYEEE